MSRRPVGLVTGGAHRLGRAFVEALVARGHDVAIHFHSARAAAESLAAGLRSAGCDVELFGADLRDAEACERVVHDVVQRFGRLDVLVNSAASFRQASLADTSAAVWDDVFALNLRAPLLLARSAAPRLSDGGVIVNIADVAAFENWSGYLAHGTAKAALVHATRALARELAPRVRVNAIAPGAVLLPDAWTHEQHEALIRSTPLGKLGSPADVVRAFEYLLDAAYVTGQVLTVDGGRTVRR